MSIKEHLYGFDVIHIQKASVTVCAKDEKEAIDKLHLRDFIDMDHYAEISIIEIPGTIQDFGIYE